MLFLIEKVSFCEDFDCKLIVIENSLKAYGEAKHALWMPLDIIDQLVGFDRLSDYSKRVLYDLRFFVRETAGLHEELKFSVQINFDDKFGLEKGEGTVLRVGYGFLTDTREWQETPLLVEDLNDGDVYSTSANAGLQLKRMLHHFGASFECVNGGGAATYKNYLRLKQKKKLFLCVVDSDKQHPNGAHGSTSSKFVPLANDFVDGHFIKILESSEIENIVPLRLVKEVVGRVFPHCMDAFDDLVTQGFRKFFDHKKGLTKKGAQQLDVSHGEYWSGLKDYEELEDEDWICPGMGSNLLDHCLLVMMNTHAHRFNKYINGYDDEEWLALGEYLCAWGLHRKKRVH